MKNEINQKELVRILTEKNSTAMTDLEKELYGEVIEDRCKISLAKMDRIIESFKAVVAQELKKGNSVTLTGFGKFLPFVRYARNANHPQKNGEIIKVPKIKIAKFRTGSNLKKTLKK